jgi:23S rRNA (pseudouridine1915-N3)-methyltransferase
MSIRLLFTGRTADPLVRAGIDDYAKRLSHYTSFKLEELNIRSSSAEKQQQLIREKEKLLGCLKTGDLLVLLDETGTEYTSKAFAGKLESWMMRGNIVFAIGGAYGFHEEVYQRADQKMALSKMTFTHQMVRLIFTEQLYRAFTIIRNEKYHH